MLARETLPGYPALTITARNETDTRVTTSGERPICPQCGQLQVNNGRRERTLFDVPHGFTPQQLIIRETKWKCRNGCPPVKDLGDLTEPARLADGKRHGNITARLRRYLEQSWGQGVAVRALAAQVGLPEAGLYERIHDWAPELHRHWRDAGMLRGLQFVGIDEVFWHRQPLVVVMDIAPNAPGEPFRRRVIDILPSRDIQVVADFLRDLQEAKRRLGEPDWHPVIATDMWGDFRIAVQQVFHGEAIHVADRFHISIKIIEDLEQAVEAYFLKSGNVTPEVRREARQRRGQIHRAYLQALRTNKPPRLPPDTSRNQQSDLTALLELALELQRFWDAPHDRPGCSPQLASMYDLRAWLVAVRQWNALHSQKAFSRLVYLLDPQSWVIEMTNGLRAGARPAAGDGQQGQLMTTARVESINSRIRRLATRSPNQRRVAAAGMDWKHWKEEQQFDHYRARLLYALNTPVPKPETHVVSMEEAAPDCACGAPGTTLEAQPTGRHGQAWDVPIAGARVRARWPVLRVSCPRCLSVTEVEVPHRDQMTDRLRHHLDEALRRDETLRSMHLRTGVSYEALKALQDELPIPPGRVPRALGVMPFTWRSRPRLALFDVLSGQPVDLLEHGEQSDLLAWLARPEAEQVEGVWVERPEWLPEDPGRVRWALDPSSAARLFQRSVQALQRDVTAGMTISRLRSPGMKGLRLSLTMNPNQNVAMRNKTASGQRAGRSAPRNRWPRVAYRLAEEQLRERRAAMRLEHPALGFGLDRLTDLKTSLLKYPEEETVMTWISSLSQETKAFKEAHPAHAVAVSRMEAAFILTTRPLKVPAIRTAILNGYRAVDPEHIWVSDWHEGVDLALVRRRMRDLHELHVKRGRDWTHFRRIALTCIGPR